MEQMDFSLNRSVPCSVINHKQVFADVYVAWLKSKSDIFASFGEHLCCGSISRGSKHKRVSGEILADGILLPKTDGSPLSDIALRFKIP
jgi:hypothetical protein